MPGLKKVIKLAKDNNLPFLKHCDGYLWPILELLVEEDINAINPVEPAAGMDIVEVKKAYGDKVTLIGNIDCAHLFSYGKTEEIRHAVKDCIHKASHGGGHILSSSNSIHTGVPPENFLTMVKAARDFGKYPIMV